MIFCKDETTGDVEADLLILPGWFRDDEDDLKSDYFVFLIEDEIVAVVNPDILYMIKKDKNYKGE